MSVLFARSGRGWSTTPSSLRREKTKKLTSSNDLPLAPASSAACRIVSREEDATGKSVGRKGAGGVASLEGRE